MILTMTTKMGGVLCATSVTSVGTICSIEISMIEKLSLLVASILVNIVLWKKLLEIDKKYQEKLEQKQEQIESILAEQIKDLKDDKSD